MSDGYITIALKKRDYDANARRTEHRFLTMNSSVQTAVVKSKNTDESVALISLILLYGNSSNAQRAVLSISIPSSIIGRIHS